MLVAERGRRVDDPVHMVRGRTRGRCRRGATARRSGRPPCCRVDSLEQLAFDDVQRAGRPAVVVQVDALEANPSR